MGNPVCPVCSEELSLVTEVETSEEVWECKRESGRRFINQGILGLVPHQKSIISNPPMGGKRILNIYWDPNLGASGRAVFRYEE